MNFTLQVFIILAVAVVIIIAVVGYLLIVEEKLNELWEEKEQFEKEAEEKYKGYSEFWEDDKALYDELISKAGDPLFIEEAPINILHGLEPIHYLEHDVVGSYWYDKLFYFDFNCDGKNQMGDRSPVGTLTLYIDYNGNERIDDGCEAMWSYSTPAHAILSEKDSDGNGAIDLNDDIWPKVRMTDWDQSWTPKELGYEYFDLTGYITLQHDECHGFIGTYANGAIGYEKDWKYDECIESGWSPIEPITNNHLRAVAYNDCGGYHEEYGCIRIYSGVLGYWEKKVET